MSYRTPQGKWVADLEWANDQDLRIERLWSRVFGGGVEYRKAKDGSEEQRSGVDRVATQLANNRPLEDSDVTLEEKVRRMPFTKYEDVLFELKHVHDDGRVRQGWAGKWPAAEMFAWVWLGGAKDACDWILALPTGLLVKHFEQVIRPKIDTPWVQRRIRSSRTNNPGYRTEFLSLPVKYAVPGNGLFKPSRIDWPEKREP